MSEAQTLTLDGAVLVIVTDEDEAPFLGELHGTEYVTSRYPVLAPMLDALTLYGWHYEWIRDDMVVLHHCGTKDFCVIDADYHTWPAAELVRAVQAAGGALAAAPPL